MFEKIMQLLGFKTENESPQGIMRLVSYGPMDKPQFISIKRPKPNNDTQ